MPLHSSWQREKAKLWSATVLCRKAQKTDWQKKREGTEQIEPFHHTPTSLTSAGIAKSSLLLHKWWTSCVPQWDVCFTACADFVPWLSLWACEAVQTRAAIPLAALTNTHPLSLTLPLPPSLSLPPSFCLYFFLSQTHTRRTVHTFAQHINMHPHTNTEMTSTALSLSLSLLCRSSSDLCCT